MNPYGGFPLLSIIVFLPLVGALIILFINKKRVEPIRVIALLTSLVVFALSLPLFFNFDSSTHELQWVQKKPWIPQYGIIYFIGIDGINLLLVLLTTFTSVLAILSSWKAITERVKEYMILMLLLETGMLGIFVSLDLFLFYIFWETMLIPMYFLIGIWGGPRKIYAAVKFFLYTMAGSVLMLVGILWLYHIGGGTTFNLFELIKVPLTGHQQLWLFLGFFLAFAIKIPMFPFHTWLPDAHVEAPTAGSVILAGVLLKMGIYGILRFCLPLFPDASIELMPIISVLAIIGIIYGALVSMVQSDLKRLVAFSSVSHLGFCVLGIFAFNMLGIQGSILQMVNHGLSTGALFLLVGMIYERRHTRMIADFGGLSKVLPLFAAFFGIVTLSSIGLPGLNGFVGEFLILVGSFLSRPLYAILAATGIVLAAVYMLWMFQRVMYGELDKPENRALKDLSVREIATMVPIIALIFFIGVFPRPFLRRMEASVQHLILQVETKKSQEPLYVEKMKERIKEFFHNNEASTD